MSEIFFHIRRRLPRLGGNSFYKDKRVREVKTFCLDEPGLYDIGWNEKAVEFNGRRPCPECVQAREAISKVEDSK